MELEKAVTNKIEQLFPAAARGAADTGSVPTRATGKDSPVAKIPAVDTVRLTGDALDLQAVEKSLDNVPVTNEARVQQLRAAIASGTYRTDATAVAQNLLRFEWDLRP